MRRPKRCIVTGGAGFIGSALVRRLLRETDASILVIDSLTYAGGLSSLRDAGVQPWSAPDALCDEVASGDGSGSSRCQFLQADVCDAPSMSAAFDVFRPDTVFHLAAESHVDRSIDSPLGFVRTNVSGTATLLQAALEYWRGLPGGERDSFLLLHASTDEVYGSLGGDGLFAESSPYAPHSPYSATKAAADHLVRAWRDTYGLPTLVTNGSNTYGPFQFPEKLIPLAILNALDGRPVRVYGDGLNVRDWLHVDDHASALALAAMRGAPGETYNVGGRCERTVLEVVREVCAALDELRPRADGKGHARLVEFVEDRPGHDRRYALDPAKAERELGWSAKEPFASGIRRTVRWYLDSEWWWRPIREGTYGGERLGLGAGAQS